MKTKTPPKTKIESKNPNPNHANYELWNVFIFRFVQHWIVQKKGKLVFWWGHLGIIWFSEPNFMKFENQLLMCKVIYFSCTLRRLHILCQNCPPCLVIFQNYPFCSFFFVLSYHHLPLPPSLVKPTGTLPASSLAATTLFFLLLHTLHKSSPLSPLSICLQYSKPTWNPGVFWYLDNVECHPKPFRGLCFF